MPKHIVEDMQQLRLLLESVVLNEAGDILEFMTYQQDGILLNVPVGKTWRTAGDGYWSKTIKDVHVSEISTWVAWDESEGASDISVEYDTDDWDDEEDGLIYGDGGFLSALHKFLIQKGFPPDLVNAIEYGEQGMQDDGRVSCDGYEFQDFIRDASITKLSDDVEAFSDVVSEWPNLITDRIDDKEWYEARREGILKSFVKLARKRDSVNISDMAKKLKAAGVTWPELDRLIK
jgi:hypothetical protein